MRPFLASRLGRALTASIAVTVVVLAFLALSALFSGDHGRSGAPEPLAPTSAEVAAGLAAPVVGFAALTVVLYLLILASEVLGRAVANLRHR